jgi:DNA (cytosine-5)-methyltransferase 1
LEFYKTVKIVKPEFFVIENVRGMLTLNGGLFVKDILNRFGKLGYNIEYKLINAADYGVPQNRQRIFFIGLKKGKYEFPEKFKKHVTVSEALNDLPSKLPVKKLKYTSEPKNEFQKLMRKNSDTIFNHDITEHSEQTIDIISMVPDGGNIKSLPAEYWNVRRYNKAFQRMNSKLPSNTIDTGHRNYFHFKENRIPTARESARIQSFPDDFEFIGTRGSQYKQIGNAVPPLLAFAVAKKISDKLKTNKNK